MKLISAETPLQSCYSCKGFKVYESRNRVKCAGCNCDGYEREYCRELKPCPVCNGTGFKDAGQYQMFEYKKENKP